RGERASEGRQRAVGGGRTQVSSHLVRTQGAHIGERGRRGLRDEQGQVEGVRRQSRSGVVFFFQAEDGIRDRNVTGVQTCALPISLAVVASAVVLTAASPAKADHYRYYRGGYGGYYAPRAYYRSYAYAPSYYVAPSTRSEERRVGKECRFWRSVYS